MMEIISCSFKCFFLSPVFSLVAFITSAQIRDTISVKKVKWKVSIEVPDSILWIGIDNQVIIKVSGGSNYTINVNGGSIKNIAGKYQVKVKKEGAATITVYEKLPEKRLRVLLTKLFFVRRIPLPVMSVCGVKADSVIDKLQIIKENLVTAFHPFYKKNVPVIGFDLVFALGGKTERLNSVNNHFTLEMQKRIYYLKSGTLLYFENIYYVLPDGTIEKLDSFELFVTETNKYKVGYRVMGL
jgi:hypothetical protein